MDEVWIVYRADQEAFEVEVYRSLAAVRQAFPDEEWFDRWPEARGNILVSEPSALLAEAREVHG